jgi:hypothetical protein
MRRTWLFFEKAVVKRAGKCFSIKTGAFASRVAGRRSPGISPKLFPAFGVAVPYGAFRWYRSGFLSGEKTRKVE